MKLKFVLLSLLPLVVSPASAAVITPISANASSLKLTSTASSLIDGSGLFTDATKTVADNSITGIHYDIGGGNLTRSWVWDDAGTSPLINGEWVEFDLGAEYQLTGTYVWQTTYDNTNRQTRTFDIDHSTNDLTYTTVVTDTLLPQVTTLANGSSATWISFGVTPITARYIHFEIDGTYERTAGDRNWLGGLGEVKFEGTAIPEPSAALLGSLGLLALLRRRRA